MLFDVPENDEQPLLKAKARLDAWAQSADSSARMRTLQIAALEVHNAMVPMITSARERIETARKVRQPGG
jgi:hypothetical protein